MADQVFISYRRDDSAGYAGRILDRLEREFGANVLFMDVDSIPLGSNFVKILHERVASCSVLLAIVGPKWLDARDEEGNRRLDNPNDFVRVEIAAALQRGIPVIPILLDGAKTPKSDQLPEDLKELALRNGLDVRHTSFHVDMNRLVAELKRESGSPDESLPQPSGRRTTTSPKASLRVNETEGGASASVNAQAPLGRIRFDDSDATMPLGSKIFENVPPRDLNFTGRQRRLVELHNIFMASSDPAGITQAAIHGLGGIGKTTLATEYVHRHAGEYAGVWWAAAEQRALLIASLANLAGRLDRRLAEEPDQEKAAKAGLMRLARFDKPFLLIYDDVETPDTIRDLVPSTGGRVLVTSRWPDWGGRAAEMKIDVLALDDAVEFLQKRTGRNDRPGATRLAAALGNLPLALDHAGAYCRLTATSFDAYRERIDARIRSAPKGAAYPASVAATFDLAIEKATSEQRSAEAVLRFFAFLAPDHIPLNIVPRGVASPRERDEALMALASVSLIEHQSLQDGSPAISLHRLVQAEMRARVAGDRVVQTATQGRVADRGGIDAVVEQVTHALLEAFPGGAEKEPRLWARCNDLLPHLLALRELALWHDESIEAGELLRRAGGYLYGRGAYREAEPLFREAIEMVEKARGHTHADVGAGLNGLALLLWASGRYGEAEPLYREAIAIGESTCGREHPDVVNRLNSLARLLSDCGRQAEAEPLFHEAIAIGERILGQGHLDVTSSRNNLGLMLIETGRYAEAEPLYRETLAIADKTVGREHLEVARCLNNLARLLRDDASRLAEAEDLEREALAIWGRLLGEHHPVVARGRENLAGIVLKRGRHEAALVEARAALDIHDESLGAAHKWTKDSARTCAAALAALGRHPEAAEIRVRYGLTQG